MIQNEYACCLRGVMEYKHSKRVYEYNKDIKTKNKRVIGILYFRDVGNEIKFIAYFIQWYLCHFYMLEPIMTTLRTEQKITSRTKGMHGDLKMGDR